jgi:hypothetical protein
MKELKRAYLPQEAKTAVPEVQADPNAGTQAALIYAGKFNS